MDSYKLGQQLYRQTESGKLKEDKWRKSEKCKKIKRIWKWKSRGIICDYDAIYDIVLETNNCDNCDRKVSFEKQNKSLDHCHKCGCVRGILCNNCNRYNRLTCYVCD